MKVLVVFIEITEYNLARIENVYEKMDGEEFTYIYCSASVSGHKTDRHLPPNATVLQGGTKEKRRQLKKILRAGNFDFIVVNGYSDILRLQAISYAKRKHIPYAIETDTQLNIPGSFLKRNIKKALLKYVFSGNVWGFAGGTRQKELFSHYGMKPERIRVLPMTVDVARFQQKCAQLPEKEPLKAENGFGNKRVVLYAGRFAEEKNILTLLRAATYLRAKQKDFLLCLVGKGEKREELETFCKQNDLYEQVRFVDYMLFDRLVAYYKMADVFVLPSKFEPWGLVVNEALACGLPVIASNRVGAVDDLILPGENGEIFPWENAEQLAVQLEKWLYAHKNETMPDIMKTWDHPTYKGILSGILMEIKNEGNN